MSFRRTGKKIFSEVEEAFQYCDICDAQLSVNAYRSVTHLTVEIHHEQSCEGDSTTWDVCSWECLAALAGKQHPNSEISPKRIDI
jgi:hypothetical protein